MSYQYPQLYAAPATQPITLAELCSGLNIAVPQNTDTEYARLNTLISVATNFVERNTDKRFVPQTWDFFYDGFPCERIEIPYSPVSEVVHLKYYDTANTLTDYTAYRAHLPYESRAFLEPVNLYWVSLWVPTWRRSDAVQVRAIIGYDIVPDIVKHCIIQVAGSLNELREGEQENQTYLTECHQNLLRMIRTWGYA